MPINRILQFRGEGFYKLVNGDGKVWLMPARNMRIAMNLYQPSGIKGKLLKHFFPLLHHFGFVRKVAGAEKVACSLDGKLYNFLCKLFRNGNLEFSVFCGTPCVHQKITIQLSSGKEILGYCKVSESEEIGGIFQRECETLGKLMAKGVEGIPECLYCGEIMKGVYAFVQAFVLAHFRW